MTNFDFRSLAESGPQNAPPSLEHALLKAFRRRKAVRRWKFIAAAAVGAVAAGICAISMLWIPPTTPPPSIQLARISPPPLLNRDRKEAVADVAPAQPRRPRRHLETAGTFYPLPGSAMLPPLDFGTVVRVDLPRSALALVGLPVNQDSAFESVRADVLLGQDGQARAVRFIQ